jgi:hypothetical protein
VRLVEPLGHDDENFDSTVFKFVPGLPEGKMRPGNNSVPSASSTTWLEHELDLGKGKKMKIFLHNSGRTKPIRPGPFKVQRAANFCAVFSETRLDQDTVQVMKM